MIGKTVSHYTILEKLGGGGMGVVYKARDEKLDRLVALKFLPPHLSADDEVKQRFISEAKAASALDHTNICTVFEIEETEDGQMFIAMAYYDGDTLKKRIESEPISVADTLKTGIQIAEGLSRAHAQSIIHRDIKPANLMITSEGIVKIVDFGLAKISDARITQTGYTLGTAAYMSPEQARGETVDIRTDLWSLGVILYEMSTGRSPFKGQQAESVIYSILNENPDPPSSVQSNIPTELEAIIVRCLEKDRDLRFSDMDEVGSELKKVLQEISGITSSGVAIPGKFARQKAKTGLIRAVVIVAAIFVAAYFGYKSYRDTQKPDEFRIGRATQLSHSPDMEIDAVISPDGAMMAYAAGIEAAMDIYVRQISGGRAIKLTEGMPGNHIWPQWAPDGTRIAFLSSGSVFSVPALGGSPRKLIAGVNNPSLAWAPDGKAIAYEQNDSIFIYDLDSGESRKIVEAHDSYALSFSPESGFLVYVSGNSDFVFGNLIGNIAPSSIWIVPVSGGDPFQLRDAKHLNTSPVWTSDGKHILFISDQDGNRDVYQMDLNAAKKPLRPPRRLTTGLDALTLSLSKNGKFLIYSKFNQKTNVWSIGIPEEGPVSASEARPVTSGNQVIEGLHVSIDGESLVFDSNRAGNQDIYKMAVAGGEPMQLTTHQSNDYYPAWSPDKNEIAFYSLRNGNRDVFVISSDGTRLLQVTEHPSDDIEPDWSPDGNQLVFFSDRTGRYELYVVARPDKNSAWETPRQLTFEGGQHAKWSPDGRLIAYVYLGRLKLISPDGAEDRLLYQTEDPETIPWPVYLDWSADSRRVFFKGVDRNREGSFWSILLAGGIPKQLVRFGDTSLKSSRTEFTSDSRSLFFTITEKESDIWMLELLTDKK